MMNQLIAKIESYGFECEAGPLSNCVDWQQLQATIEQQDAKIAKLITESDGWQNRFDLKEQELHQLQMNYEASESHRFVMGERITKLEERIRVADAEEPVAWMYSDEEGNDAFTNNPTFMNNQIYHGHLPVPLYLHAQIPAEVAPSSDIVPDRYCKQSKCANTTTGCVGHCRLDELSKGLSVTYTCQLVKEK